MIKCGLDAEFFSTLLRFSISSNDKQFCWYMYAIDHQQWFRYRAKHIVTVFSFVPLFWSAFRMTVSKRCANFYMSKHWFPVVKSICCIILMRWWQKGLNITRKCTENNYSNNSSSNGGKNVNCIVWSLNAARHKLRRSGRGKKGFAMCKISG